MSTTSDDRELQERFQRMGDLLQEVQNRADPAVLGAVQEIVQALLDFHAAGLARILEQVPDTTELGRDELVSSLLILHGLHPQDLETRVRAALDAVAPALQEQNGSAELVALGDGNVHVRLHGGGHGCGSTQARLHKLVEDALYAAAPDLIGLHIEAETPPPTTTFIPIEQLQARLNTQTKEMV